MNNSTPRKGPQALDIKSATIYTVRLVLHSSNTNELLEALDQRLQEAGAFFQNEVAVIDCNAIYDPIEWEPILTILRRHQLIPIAMTGNAEQIKHAAQYDLPAVELASAKTIIDIPEPIPEPTPEPSPAPIPAAPLVLNQTLRSGQRFFAPDGDLIVTGLVGQGAEVIATGNIYVHGPLRGKAIAGANGNTNAFIIATEFDPELIAIAGVYSVIENPTSNAHHKQGVLIQLDGETLTFKPLNE